MGMWQYSVAQPNSARLSAAQPGMVRPSAAQPGMVRPSAAQPGMVRPSAAQPGMVRPSAAQPGMVRPSAAQPGTVRLSPACLHEESPRWGDETLRHTAQLDVKLEQPRRLLDAAHLYVDVQVDLLDGGSHARERWRNRRACGQRLRSSGGEAWAAAAGHVTYCRWQGLGSAAQTTAPTTGVGDLYKVGEEERVLAEALHGLDKQRVEALATLRLNLCELGAPNARRELQCALRAGTVAGVHAEEGGHRAEGPRHAAHCLCGVRLPRSARAA